MKINWIDSRAYKYFYWRISSAEGKQLDELIAILNELNNKYPNVCNELLKIIK